VRGGEVGRGIGAVAVEQRQRDVLLDGQARQEVEGLEDEADAVGPVPGPPVGVEAGDLLAVEDDAAFARRVHEAEDVHERRLARARGAEDGDEFALLEIQIHAVQSMDVLIAHAVGLAEAADGDERRHLNY
jgi:hypothetical protein